MALITTIPELKKYLSIDGNASMDSLRPFIDQAEQLFVKDLLGQAFYDYYLPLYITSMQEGGTALSADNARLLPYIQRCLAFYTQMLAIPNLAVTFGDMGTRQHRADNSDAAPRWLQEKLQFNALKFGDTHADALLAFLEANASVSVYSQWYGSTAYTRSNGLIVYSATIASKHIDINDSRRVYLKLRSKIRDIETRIIPKLIGQAQYDDLVTDIKANTLSDEYKALIEKLEPVIARRALHLQLPFMRVQVNENGIYIYSGTDDIFKLGQLATDADIKILRAQLIGGGKDELGYLNDEEELRQFILANIDDYPLIKASNVYTVQPDPGPTWESKNDPNDKHFIV